MERNLSTGSGARSCRLPQARSCISMRGISFNCGIRLFRRSKSSREIFSGTLQVGASTIPGTYILPGLIGTFKASYPSIQITLKIGGSGSVVGKILDGSVEFGMIGAKWDDKRIELEETYSDELILVVYPGHPWEKRKEVDVRELGDMPFILRERGSGYPSRHVTGLWNPADFPHPISKWLPKWEAPKQSGRR